MMLIDQIRFREVLGGAAGSYRPASWGVEGCDRRTAPFAIAFALCGKATATSPTATAHSTTTATTTAPTTSRKFTSCCQI